MDKLQPLLYVIIAIPVIMFYINCIKSVYKKHKENKQEGLEKWAAYYATNDIKWKYETAWPQSGTDVIIRYYADGGSNILQTKINKQELYSALHVRPVEDEDIPF